MAVFAEHAYPLETSLRTLGGMRRSIAAVSSGAVAVATLVAVLSWSGGSGAATPRSPQRAPASAAGSRDAAPFPPTRYGSVGGSDTAGVPDTAVVSSDQTVAVWGFYNRHGQLCVDLNDRHIGASLMGCANPEPDGRQLPSSVVLPSPDGAIIGGLAPDDVPAVTVIDDHGAGHQAAVTDNAWTLTLPSGRQVSRLAYQHSDGQTETLPG
jgi:hypothetical protein